MSKCDHCKGSGWAWDEHAFKKAKKGGRWTVEQCRKWDHCGWCSGTGFKDDWECGYCNGHGWKSDDSYSEFECPWCDGKGCTKDAPADWKRHDRSKKKPDPKKGKARTKASGARKKAEVIGDRWDLI